MSQPFNFDGAQPEHIIKHRVTGCPEIAYEFTCNGNRYCVLANSIFSIAKGIDSDILAKFVDSKWFGVELGQQEIMECYDDNDTALCSLGLFEGLGFLIDHETSEISCIPPASLPSFTAFFYGRGSYSGDTMNQKFELTGFVKSDGTFGDTSDATVRVQLDASDFHLGDPVSLRDKNSQYQTADTLYYNGKCIKNDIMSCRKLVNGICVKDFDGDYSFVSYNPPKAVSLNPIDKLQNDSMAFTHERYLYFYAGNALLKMGYKALERNSHSIFSADVGGQSFLEFSLGIPNAISFHVQGYILTDEHGNEVMWDGQTMSQREIARLGLDSDMTDLVSQAQPPIPAPMLIDEPPASVPADDFIADERKSMSVNKIIEHSNKEVNSDSSLFRTEFVDRLYEILTDRSLCT